MNRCLIGLTLLTALAPTAHALTVDCGHLLDVKNGVWLEAISVQISGGKIVDISPVDVAGTTIGEEHIDLSKDYCLPGLIDSHTHLTDEFSATTYSDQFRLNPADYAIRGVANARKTLEAGFTTVRNLGDGHNESIALRNAIAKGVVPGPRIFTAGKAIGSTGGHADDTDGYRADLADDPGPADGIINSPEDARKAVRQHYKDGADLIKIMPSGGVLDESRSADNPQMTEDEIKAVVDIARDYGFSVAAHAHGTEGIRRAVVGGVDSIEHGTFMDGEDMRLMKQHGTWYVPTVIAGKHVTEKAQIAGYFPPQVAAKALQIGPKIQATLNRAYKAGVRIAFGTDAGVYPHGENAGEFGYMVEAGLPPIEAIRAATINAAQLLRQSDKLGSIEPGFAADLIAVDGDALRDVSLLKKVRFVMKDGVVYKGP
jgi:imidazolonepropionase-like amidohydrolase